MRAWVSALLALCWAGTSMTQAELPNPSFEEGTTAPEGWRLVGSGDWGGPGRTGAPRR
ncbi:MAG: hypothetical protein KatS3mg115_1069 [Candidatus Poribacteria bacterium]|nr:MAG: hypothetical protein KatS3mg115_1069 [Candidatus Poribacteria bacterium]